MKKLTFFRFSKNVLFTHAFIFGYINNYGLKYFIQKLSQKIFSLNENAHKINYFNKEVQESKIDPDFITFYSNCFKYLSFFIVFFKLRVSFNHKKNKNFTTSFKKFHTFNKKKLKHHRDIFLSHIDSVGQNYKFIFYIYSVKEKKDFLQTVKSINNQIYKNFEIYSSCRAQKQFSMKFLYDNHLKLLDSNCDYLIPVESGDILDELLLYRCFDRILEKDNKVDLIYFDNLFFDVNDMLVPFIKPQFSPDYLEAINYLGSVICIKSKLFNDSFLFFTRNENIYDLILKVTERAKMVEHIDSFLFSHKLPSAAKLKKVADLEKNALAGRLKRTGRIGNIISSDSVPSTYYVDIYKSKQILISIVIPTAGKSIVNKKSKIDLISNLLGQIRQKSTYKNLEIIVVDGGELSTSQIEVVSKYNCKRLTHNNVNFNFSNSCNIGAAKATGKYIIFLNDDIEIITHDWVEKLLNHFYKNHVGVVGAKLLYPNGKIQHAGVVFNSGCPDHVADGLDDYPGYFFSAYSARNFSAVTGACLMIRKSLFDEIGGFNEMLASNFNDIDLCLRVRGKGYFVLLEPSCRLTHMTSMSRNDFKPSSEKLQKELKIFHDIWTSGLVSDPYYNSKYLDTCRPTFSPRFIL